MVSGTYGHASGQGELPGVSEHAQLGEDRIQFSHSYGRETGGLVEKRHEAA